MYYIVGMRPPGMPHGVAPPHGYPGGPPPVPPNFGMPPGKTAYSLLHLLNYTTNYIYSYI